MLSIKLYLTIEIILVLDRVYLNTGVPRELICDWVKEVERRVASRGGPETIAWIKLIRLSCTRYLAGQPMSNDPSLGLQLDERGLPAGEVPIVELVVDRDPSKVRLLLTLLGVSRVIRGWNKPNLAPITDAYGGQPLELEGQKSRLTTDLVAVLTELGWSITVPVWSRCHLSTKAGPNAQALIGSVEDASLLPKSFLSAMEVIGGKDLIRTIETIRLLSPLAWLEKIVAIIPKYLKERSCSLVLRGRLSRLSLVKDKEAKCRIVAILDYWTQSCLKPLHDAVFAFLRSLTPDCTFSQGSFRSKLPLKGPYYSFDLSNATDRFPVDLQVLVLSVLISPEFAEAWRHLIIDRDYLLSWDRSGATVRYAVGQPMGAYSSWAVFSLTHHVIVRLAAKRAGCGVSFTKYVLLGDDIVIADAAVAEQYRMILSEIGVEISTVKSHVSNTTYEFAKRWIHNGEEVTGAPLGSLFEGIRVGRKSLQQAYPGSKRLETVDLAEQDPRKFVKYCSYYNVSLWIGEIEQRWLARSRTLASRGLFAAIFTLLSTNQPYARRLADKAWRYFLVPSRDDTRHLRRVKSETLASILLGGILSCNQVRLSHLYLMIYLTECKARILETAIKRQVGRFRDFQLEVAKWADLVPEGLDAQSLLLSLPPVAVLRNHIADLQLEFDKIRKTRTGETAARWLHLELRLFIEPFATLSTRTSKVVASNKASVLNLVPRLVDGISKSRAMMLSECDVKVAFDFLKRVRQGDYIFRFPKRGPTRAGASKPSLTKRQGIRSKTTLPGKGLPNLR